MGTFAVLCRVLAGKNMTRDNLFVWQMPGGHPGYTNAQPLSHNKISNAPPPGLTTRANAPQLPGVMDFAGID